MCVRWIACTQNSYQGEVAEWDPQLYVRFDGKFELEKYFDLLNAKNIQVNTDEDDNYEGLLSLRIEESAFIRSKFKQGQSTDYILQRLAFLLASRVEYLNSYKGVEVVYTSKDPELSLSQFYSLEDLGFPIFEEADSEVIYDEDLEEY